MRHKPRRLYEDIVDSHGNLKRSRYGRQGLLVRRAGNHVSWVRFSLWGLPAHRAFVGHAQSTKNYLNKPAPTVRVMTAGPQDRALQACNLSGGPVIIQHGARVTGPWALCAGNPQSAKRPLSFAPVL